MTDRVTLFEMGPRDGLQNETVQIATADKIALVDLLSACGFTKIEVTSFVSPRWVPQMANATEVLAGITRAPGVSYAALTPNLRGFDGALAAKADEVAIFASASEGFSRANINCSIDESLARFAPVAQAARDADLPLRGYVSCVTDCPYDGPTDPAQVLRVAQALIDLGAYEVSLGDTIGAATPETTKRLLDRLLDHIPATRLAGHFHDTGGRALDNIAASLDRGLRTFDAAIGGLGGCPYAPGAKGNVATEAVTAMLADRGFDTGLDPQALDRARAFAQNLRSPR
ncbi:hydroxymethylglutaryl-CoA lyase [Salipiger sp. IMCC34102]|uniref:hydroxymethylglutaryl-CoA lyase n=1 Tax=Salipiger sp. IMCC34102 TaxID=2510647 RepID=UPI00101CB257|nr:hydroxymethylglutaryl-CoA lyase [Salipiger sp. IMCC34102]RYH03050.1 hydroxymethylglutaryl-CoA lyase [Salipiger sp. IMCC34102]